MPGVPKDKKPEVDKAIKPVRSKEILGITEQ